MKLGPVEPKPAVRSLSSETDSTDQRGSLKQNGELVAPLNPSRVFPLLAGIWASVLATEAGATHTLSISESQGTPSKHLGAEPHETHQEVIGATGGF